MRTKSTSFLIIALVFAANTASVSSWPKPASLRWVYRGGTTDVFPIDIDGDGLDEMLAASYPYLDCYDGSSLIWSVTINASISSIVHGNADLDGAKELVVLTDDGRIFLIEEGLVETKLFTPFRANFMLSADIVSDEMEEVVLVGDEQAARLTDLTLEPLFSEEISGAWHHDINSDGKEELLISSRNKLVCLTGGGQRLWEFQAEGLIEDLTFASFGGRNTSAVLLSVDRVRSVSSTGELQWTQEFFCSSVLASDLDGDSIDEVLCSGIKGVLCLGSGGRRIWSLETLVSEFLAHDVDGDGFREVLLTNSDGLFCYDHSGNSKWHLDVRPDKILPLDRGVLTMNEFELALVSGGQFLWGFEIPSELVLQSIATCNAIGDSSNEVILTGNGIACLDSNGELLWDGGRKHDFLGVRQVVLGEIDEDGRSEVIASSLDGKIAVLTLSGEVKRVLSFAGFFSLADVDRDGAMEVIGADVFSFGFPGLTLVTELAGGEHTYCIEGDGTVKWSYSRDALGDLIEGLLRGLLAFMGVFSIETMSSAAIGDLNGDGVQDVAIGTNSYFSFLVIPLGKFGAVTCLDGSDGEPMWASNISGRTIDELLICDQTVGPGGNVVVLAASDELFCFSSTGRVAWRKGVEGAHLITSGDLDGDGFDEIIATTTSGLCAMGPGGKVEVNLTSPMIPRCLLLVPCERGRHRILVGGERGVALISERGDLLMERNIDGTIVALAAGDIDGDSALEYVIGGELGEIYCLDEEFEVTWLTDLHHHGLPTLCLHDVDGDGREEALVGESSGFMAFSIASIDCEHVVCASLTFEEPQMRVGEGEMELRVENNGTVEADFRVFLARRDPSVSVTNLPQVLHLKPGEVGRVSLALTAKEEGTAHFVVGVESMGQVLTQEEASVTIRAQTPPPTTPAGRPFSRRLLTSIIVLTAIALALILFSIILARLRHE